MRTEEDGDGRVIYGDRRIREQQQRRNMLVSREQSRQLGEVAGWLSSKRSLAHRKSSSFVADMIVDTQQIKVVQ